MLALNFRDSQPIYHQIKDGLRRLIAGGALEPGEKLPTVRAMSMDLAINPKAVARAYSELESEGLIRAVPGEGHYAQKAPESAERVRREMLMEDLQVLLAELRELGVTGEELAGVLREGGAK